MGTNTEEFHEVGTSEIRKAFNIPESVIFLLSVGELNINKNHQVVIWSLAEIQNKNLYHVIAGGGEQKNQRFNCRVKTGRSCLFAGYRTDIKKFFADSDLYTLPSFREGLNVRVMEAMASGIPCLVSDIRGNRDLIDEQGGYDSIYTI